MKMNDLIKGMGKASFQRETLKSIANTIDDYKDMISTNTEVSIENINAIIRNILTKGKEIVNEEMDILKRIIELLFNERFKNEDILSLNISHIFQLKHQCYKSNKMIKTLSDYYKTIFPNEFSISFNDDKEEEFDILVENTEEVQGEKIVIYSWKRGVIKRKKENDDSIEIALVDENIIYTTKLNTLLYAKKGTLLSDDDLQWRRSIKVGDVIDALDTHFNWRKGKILDVIYNMITISFNVDNNSNYLYDEKNNVKCSKYSGKIQRKGTYSFDIKYKELDLGVYFSNKNSFFNSNMTHFPFIENYTIVPKKANDAPFVNMTYLTIANYFISKLIENKNKIYNKGKIEYLFCIIDVLVELYPQLHIVESKNIIRDLFENYFKKVLMCISLDKKKNAKKTSVLNQIKNMSLIMQGAYYEFEIYAYMGHFQLEFGLNCIKNSENLEKTLLGLTTLTDALNDCALKNPSNEILTFIQLYICSPKFDDNDFFAFLLNSSNHIEIIRQTKKIISPLFKLRLINSELLNYIYNFIITCSKETGNREELYEILLNNTDYLQEELRNELIHRITSLSYDQLTREDIKLVVSAISSVNIVKYKNLAKEVIDYLYHFMVNKINISDITNDFLLIPKMLKSIKGEEEKRNMIVRELIFDYITRIITDMYNQDNVNMFYTFLVILSKVLTLTSAASESGLEYKIRFHLLNENSNIEKLNFFLFEYFNQNDATFKSEIFSHIDNIFHPLNEKKYILEKNIPILFDIFAFNNTKLQYRSEFIKWVTTLSEDNHIFTNSFEQLAARMKEYAVDFVNSDNFVDKELIGYFYKLYLQVNEVKEDEIDYLVVNPLQFKGTEIIWEILIKFSFSSLLEKFISLFSFRKVKQITRYEYWKQLVDLAFNTLKANDDKEEYIKSVLYVLKMIITYSEFYGTAECVPHSAFSSKESYYKIKLINKMNPHKQITKEKEFLKKTTIYQVSKDVSEMFNIPLLSFSIENDSSLFTLSQNGTSLDSMFFTPKEFSIIQNRQIKRAELFQSSQDGTIHLSNDVESILLSEFSKYSKDGEYMTQSECSHFLIIAENKTEVKLEVKKFFAQCGVAVNSDRISKKEFLQYFIKLYGKKEWLDTFWRLLWNLQYRNDLQRFKAPLIDSFYENEKKELMPRYFISQNKSYFKALLNLIDSNNNDISEKASALVDSLETNREIYKDIEANKLKVNSDNAKKDLNEKIYELQLINAIFLSEDKQQWKEEFVYGTLNEEGNKSQFEMLLDSFVKDKIQLNNDSRMAELKYYNLQLKIIKNSLQFIVNDPSLQKMFISLLTTYLTYLDDEKKEEELSKEVHFDKDIFSKYTLHLISVIDIISSNLKFLCNFSKKYNIKKENIILCNQVVGLIMLDYNESDLSQMKIKEDKYIDFILNNIIYNPPFSQKRLELLNLLIVKNLKDNQSFLNRFITKISDSLVYNIEHLILVDNPRFTFEIYRQLLIYLTNVNLVPIIDSLVSTLMTGILKEGGIPFEVLSGYFKLISSSFAILENRGQVINLENYNELLLILIDKFLLIDIDSVDNSDNIENVNDQNKRSYSEIGNLFYLLTRLLSNEAQKNIKAFFTNSKIINIKKYISEVSEEKKSFNITMPRGGKQKYTGLYNPSSICYMNSVLQQFFSLPPFKNSIIQIDNSISNDNEDDLLYQLQKIFCFLEKSKRKAYSHLDFVHSFKDIDGNPTDYRIQCDAQEFLTRFIEQIEGKLKGTKDQHLLYNIFGGETYSSLRCTNSLCLKVSHNIEKIYYLSLDIKQCTNLTECLNKFISEEIIEGFTCEQCKMKITHKKNYMLSQLPNILIIHLQRFAFNYETFLMEKSNNVVQFDKTISLKEFVYEENAEGKTVEDYEYNLIGVVVHAGTAEFGHYFSLISEKDKSGKWHKFNDDTVVEYNVNMLEKDTFGGVANGEWGSQEKANAYMLIYEKKNKRCVLRGVDKEDKEDKGDIKEFENERELRLCMNNELIGHRVNIKETNEKVDIISFDDLTNVKDGKDKYSIKLLNEVNEDNNKFENDKKINSQSFADFVSEVTKQLKIMIISNKLSEEEVIEYIKVINNIIFSVITNSPFLGKLNEIIDSIISIIKYSTGVLKFYLCDFLRNNQTIFMSKYLITNESALGASMSRLVSNIISTSINSKIEAQDAYSIINYFLSFIPVEISKKWNIMTDYLEVFLLMVINSEDIKKYFITQRAIRLFADFIACPEEKKDDRRQMGNNNTQPNFTPLIKTICELVLYTDICNDCKIEDDDFSLLQSEKFLKRILLAMDWEINENFTALISKLNNKDNMIKNKLYGFIFNDSSIIKKFQSNNDIIFALLCLLIDHNDDIEQIRKIYGIPQISMQKDNILHFKYAKANDITRQNIFGSFDIINEQTVKFVINLIQKCIEYVKVFKYFNEELPSFNSFNESYLNHMIFNTEQNLNIAKQNGQSKSNSISTHLEFQFGLLKEKIIQKYNLSKFKGSEKILSETTEIIKKPLTFFSLYKSTYECGTIKEGEGEVIAIDSVEYYKDVIGESKKIRKVKNEGDVKYKVNRIFAIAQKDLTFKIKIPQFCIQSEVEVKGNQIVEIVAFKGDCSELEINVEVYKISEEAEEKENGEAIGKGNEENYYEPEKVVINCPLCGTINELSEESDYKCIACSAFLFQ